MQWVSINTLYLYFYLDFYFYLYRVQSNWEMLAAVGSVVCILEHSQLLSGPTTDNCIPANSCNLIRIYVQDTRIIHSYNHIRGEEIYPNGMLTLYHFQFTSCKVMCVMKHRRNTICRKHIRQGRTDTLPRGGGGCCLLLYY